MSEIEEGEILKECYCKKNFYLGSNYSDGDGILNILFEKGKKYIYVEESTYYVDGSVFVIYNIDGDFGSTGYRFKTIGVYNNTFSDYFLSHQEVRKMKLDIINK